MGSSGLLSWFLWPEIRVLWGFWAPDLLWMQRGRWVTGWARAGLGGEGRKDTGPPLPLHTAGPSPGPLGRSGVCPGTLIPHSPHSPQVSRPPAQGRDGHCSAELPPTSACCGVLPEAASVLCRGLSCRQWDRGHGQLAGSILLALGVPLQSLSAPSLSAAASALCCSGSARPTACTSD